MPRQGPVDEAFINGVRDAQQRRTEAVLELWNVRVAHLRHGGNSREIWETLNDAILSAGDNCECNQGCNVPCGSMCGSLNSPVDEVEQPWTM